MIVLEFVVDYIFPLLGIILPLGLGSICFLYGSSIVSDRIDSLRRLPNADMVPAKLVGSTHPKGNWRLTILSYDVEIKQNKIVRLTKEVASVYLRSGEIWHGEPISTTVAYDRKNKRLFPNKATAINEIIGYSFLIMLGILFLIIPFV